MNELVGHKVLSLEISEGEMYLRFATDKGEIVYETYGDCCSETWFSEIMNLDFLINHTVMEVSNLRLPDDLSEFKDDHCRQEHDSFYGYRIATEAGHSTIVFRNSSNGYYGGSCQLVDDKDGQNRLELSPNLKKTSWTDISHLPDWTAYEPTQGSFKHYLKLKAFW